MAEPLTPQEIDAIVAPPMLLYIGRELVGHVERLTIEIDGAIQSFEALSTAIADEREREQRQRDQAGDKD